MSKRNPIDRAHLERLRQAAGPGPVLILTHDNPDPDALAGGKALATLLRQLWGIPSRLVYTGLVARAENRVMLARLTPEWEPGEDLTELEKHLAVALVDTQPGAGNHRLPAEFVPQIVVDHHHPIREKIADVRYADVRPKVGATGTMLLQYFQAAGLEPDATLATAMFYGLKTDTRGLSRGTSPEDESAYLELLARIDRRLLIEIEQAGLTPDYFRAFSRGLQATRLYQHAAVARLGLLERPDLTAEMADLLIRLEDVRAVLCQGQHGTTIYVSLRTKPLTEDAGQLIQGVIVPPGNAGGHRSMAGGQVPLEGQDGEQVMREVEERFLRQLGAVGGGAALLGE